MSSNHQHFPSSSSHRRHPKTILLQHTRQPFQFEPVRKQQDFAILNFPSALDFDQVTVVVSNPDAKAVNYMVERYPEAYFYIPNRAYLKKDLEIHPHHMKKVSLWEGDDEGGSTEFSILK